MGFFSSIAGAVKGVASGAESLASQVVADVRHDPLGAIGAGVVALSAAPAVAIAAAGAATVGPAVWLGAKGTDALGVTHGAADGLANAVKSAVTHPAEIGRMAVAAEVAVAGAVVGGKAGGALEHLGSQGLAGKVSGATDKASGADTVAGQVAPTPGGLWSRFENWLAKELGL
jgi:hypothetical protein